MEIKEENLVKGIDDIIVGEDYQLIKADDMRVISRGVKFKVTGKDSLYFNIRNSVGMTDKWNINNYLNGRLRLIRTF